MQGVKCSGPRRHYPLSGTHFRLSRDTRFLVPDQADPLPNLRDPITQDLEEERDALFRAIQELDARADLPEQRRAELHTRYEAKAAKVLRALDERQAELRGQTPVKRPATPAPRALRRAQPARTHGRQRVSTRQQPCTSGWRKRNGDDFR